MTKYKAVKCEEEGVTFDSLFERDVYRTLRLFLPYGSINCHHRLVIAPASDRYPEWVWKVDFFLPKWDIAIEAKGAFTDEWKSKMRAIDAINPKIQERLMVVSQQSARKINRKLYTINTEMLSRWLMNRTTQN